MNDEEFCRLLPKCELHAHLSGSLSPATLKKLLEYHKQTWPNEELGKLADGLIDGTTTMVGLDFTIFSVIQSVTDNAHAIRTATHDVIREFMADGVKYLEIRSTPRAVENRMSKLEYCESILSEIALARNAGLEITVTYMLSLDRRKIEEFDNTVALYFQLKEKYPEFISGIDISGHPEVNDIACLLPKLSELRLKNVKVSIHLAEVFNERETMDVLKYRPDRIGHGTFIHPSTGGNEQLLQQLLASASPVEVCLTSNIVGETSKSYEEHHAKYLYEVGVPIAICTDDKGVFSCTLSDEYYRAMKYFGWDRKIMYKLSFASINYLFTDLIVKNELKRKFEEWKATHECLFS